MNGREDLMDVDGLNVASVLDPALVSLAMKYKPVKGEIIVASWPKCGMLWTAMTVMILRKRGEPV